MYGNIKKLCVRDLPCRQPPSRPSTRSPWSSSFVYIILYCCACALPPPLPPTASRCRIYLLSNVLWKLLGHLAAITDCVLFRAADRSLQRHGFGVCWRGRARFKCVYLLNKFIEYIFYICVSVLIFFKVYFLLFVSKIFCVF